MSCIHASWQPYLQKEFKQPYFLSLANFLKKAYQSETIFPPKQQVFSAFAAPLEQIKVVILGQDPYHGKGQAHGLAFSVSPHVPLPPSLQNIFQEIKTDCGECRHQNGCLTSWSQQGVLLLNNTLTVKQNSPGSHRHKGWEQFTTKIVTILAQRKQPIVFMLWGRDAQTKASLITTPPHLVLQAAHPSPFSAHRGFFGCKHFSRANAFLCQHGLKPIVW